MTNAKQSGLTMQSAFECGHAAVLERTAESACAGSAPAISTRTLFDLLQTLQNITKGLRARWDQDLRASIPGMNASRAHLMVHLAQEGAIPQVRLARLAGFSEMTLTRLLDELERASWVVREPTPIDRRVHAIRLTIDGRRTLTAIHLNSREFIRRNLGATDEEHVGGLIAALAALK